jgi:phosphoenolpyruvate---glycerone phosphotransferase subunit DhaL
MEMYPNREGARVLDGLVQAVRDNAAALSEIDGAIGDGDHGVNMAKGFSLCAQRLAGTEYDLATGLMTLGSVLLNEIGGAMGPLYGTFFREMAKPAMGKEKVDGPAFRTMLRQGCDAVAALGGAHVGDKTLLDVLVPANEAFASTLDKGGSFAEALLAMSQAAERGKESTRDMIAKMGRASRLGERSRGVLDAGAASCALILSSLASSLTGRLLREE